MIGMRRACGVLLLLLLTACTTTTPGTPTPPTTTAAPAPALPPRPRDIPLDGVDPCSLLTEDQRAELGLDLKPSPDRSPSLLYPGEEITCVIRRVSPPMFVAVTLITSAGIEFYGSGKLVGEFRPVEAAGFPGFLAIPTRQTDFCKVVVDVAPGQLVDIQYADGGGTPPMPQDQLCDGAQHTADLVVTTLAATR